MFNVWYSLGNRHGLCECLISFCQCQYSTRINQCSVQYWFTIYQSYIALLTYSDWSIVYFQMGQVITRDFNTKVTCIKNFLDNFAFFRVFILTILYHCGIDQSYCCISPQHILTDRNKGLKVILFYTVYGKRWTVLSMSSKRLNKLL